MTPCAFLARFLMNSGAILRQLERLTPGAPRAALEAAMKQKGALIPELLALLDQVTGNMATVVEDLGFVLHIPVFLDSPVKLCFDPGQNPRNN